MIQITDKLPSVQIMADDERSASDGGSSGNNTKKRKSDTETEKTPGQTLKEEERLKLKNKKLQKDKEKAEKLRRKKWRQKKEEESKRKKQSKSDPEKEKESIDETDSTFRDDFEEEEAAGTAEKEQQQEEGETIAGLKQLVTRLTSTLGVMQKSIEKLEANQKSDTEPKKKKKKNSKAKKSGDFELTDTDSSSSESMGESSEAENALYYQPPRPADNLGEKMKKKIWKDEYIDFHDLLDKELSSYTLKFHPGKGKDSFKLEPEDRSKLTHAEWIQAFSTYKACYLKKFEHERYSKKEFSQVGQDLIQYEMTINRMKEENLDWHYFDKKFRKERQHAKYSYSYPRPDLYAEATSRSLKMLDRRMEYGSSAHHSRHQDQKFRGQDDTPGGFCYAYHRPGARCQDYACTYKHKCYHCYQTHPAYTCSTQKRFKPAYEREHNRREGPRRQRDNRRFDRQPNYSNKSRNLGKDVTSFLQR